MTWHDHDAIKDLLRQCKGSLANTKRRRRWSRTAREGRPPGRGGLRKERMTCNAPSSWVRVAELAHPTSAVSDPPKDHFAMPLLAAQVGAQGNDALTVHSSAVKCKWIRWKGNNHETRAGRPCKDATLNVSVLEDIAELFPEGAFLKPSAARLQHQEVAQSFSILHFGMLQSEHFSQYEMHGLATSRVAREGTRSLIFLLPPEHGEVRSRCRRA